MDTGYKMGPEEAWSVAMTLDGHSVLRSVYLLTKAGLAQYHPLGRFASDEHTGPNLPTSPACGRISRKKSGGARIDECKAGYEKSKKTGRIGNSSQSEGGTREERKRK